MSLHVVTAEIANGLYAIPANAVVELLRCDTGVIRRLPRAVPPIIGVTLHRGQVISVLDGRVVVGERSFAETMNDVAAMIQQREQDHVAWLNELRRCCDTGDEFTKALDPHQCAFGCWYDGVTKDKESITQLSRGSLEIEYLLESFNHPHQAIHGCATRAWVAQSGDLDAAREIIATAWNQDLAQLKNLFACFIQEIRSAYAPTTIVLRHEDNMFGLLVDSVESVRQINEDLRPPPVECRDSGLIDGICTEFSEGPAFMLNIAALVPASRGPELAETAAS